jgi:hypothetical protein
MCGSSITTSAARAGSIVRRPPWRMHPAKGHRVHFGLRDASLPADPKSCGGCTSHRRARAALARSDLRPSCSSPHVMGGSGSYGRPRPMAGDGCAVLPPGRRGSPTPGQPCARRHLETIMTRLHADAQLEPRSRHR